MPEVRSATYASIVPATVVVLLACAVLAAALRFAVTPLVRSWPLAAAVVDRYWLWGPLALFFLLLLIYAWVLALVLAFVLLCLWVFMPFMPELYR
jgi:hypothetical protein